MSHEPARPDDADRVRNQSVAKGAVVNALGTAGKLLIVVFAVLLTRLFGPEIAGVYWVAWVILEMVAQLTVSGIKDGVVVFAAYDLERGDRPAEVHGVLANAMVFTTVVGVVLVGVAYTAGDWLVLRYSGEPELLRAVHVMVLALPLTGFAQVVIAGTKAQMVMKWDAIVFGFVRPATLVVAALVGVAIDRSLTTLAVGYLVSWVVVAALCVGVFARLFSFAQLWAAMVGFRLSRPLLAFVVPQNLNMAFSAAVTNLDILMLGFFRVPAATIALYASGAKLVTNIGQVKLALSGAYGPVIARMHAAGDREGMSRSFSTVSRWATTLALALTFMVVLFHRELMLMFSPTFTGDMTFMMVLLVPPLLSCSVGMAGNIVVMSGHARWNLLNSVTVALLNAGLNFVLIPVYGLVGAAVASASAAAVVSLMQTLEARLLTGARLAWRELWKTLVAGAGGGALTAMVVVLAGESLWLRVGGAVAVLVVYAGVLLGLGLYPRDRELLSSLRSRDLATPKTAP